MHWKRWYKHGTTDRTNRPSPQERLRARLAEQWRPVPGYEHRYEVSDQGRVRSWAVWHHDPGPRILRTTRTQRGHLRVRLCLEPGKSSVWLVHQLVMFAFAGPRPEGMVIRHLDGNKLNNTPTNLSYGTVSDNAQDGRRLGEYRDRFPRKTHCPSGHPYSVENSYVYPSGARKCRACQREHLRRLRKRRRAA